MKDYIIHLIDYQKFDFSNLSSETKKTLKDFPLDEIEYILKHNLTMGNILVKYFNFHNIDKFLKLSSELIFASAKSSKFTTILLGRQFKNLFGAIISLKYEDLNQLKKLIKLRNQLTHDFNSQPELSENEVENYADLVINFCSGVNDTFMYLFGKNHGFSAEKNPENLRFTYK